MYAHAIVQASMRYRHRKPYYHYYRKTLHQSMDPSHPSKGLDLEWMRARENCLDWGFEDWVG